MTRSRVGSTRHFRTSRALTIALNEIAENAARYDIIGADIYEVLDQPDLLIGPDAKPNQAQFGIFKFPRWSYRRFNSGTKISSRL
jgi:hypothetical protein